MEVATPQVDEKPPADKDVFSQISEIAEKKAGWARSYYPHHLIIAADTEVILEGRLWGKPKSREEAKAMLLALSGRTHIVATSVVVLFPRRERYLFQEKTLVTLARFSADDLDEYLSCENPLDKAGGYGIQDFFGACFIERIDGCFYNVMGFPLPRFCQFMSRLEFTDT